MSILKAMEVEVLRERTMDDQKAARARGKTGGRKTGSYNKERAKATVALYKQGTAVREILTITGIKSKATLYEYLRWEGVFE